MKYSYKPRGVCSSKIDLEIEDGVVQRVRFTHGCDGNAKGVAALVKGMPADEVIERLNGITCSGKSTSCPDQLSRALREALAQSKE